jgi:cysteine-rich repeat protein
VVRQLVLAGVLTTAAVSEAWYVRLEPRPLRCGLASGVAADGAGDVYAAGITYDCFEGGSRPVVVKLRGSDGTELWRHETLDGTSGECTGTLQMAVDATGAVALTGGSNPCYDDGEPNAGFAARLTPDGDLAWVQNLGAATRTSGALTGDLHVVMAGDTLVGLDRLSGAVAWSRPLDADGYEMRVTDVGRAVVAAADGASVRVAAYDAASGAPLWSAVVPGRQGYQQRLLLPGTLLGTDTVVVTAGNVLTALSPDGTTYWTNTVPADTIVGAVLGAPFDMLLGSFVRGAIARPANMLLLHGYYWGGYENDRRLLAGGPTAPGQWIMHADDSGRLVFAGSGSEGRLIDVATESRAPRWDWALDGERLAGDPLGFYTGAVATDADGNVLLGGLATESGDIEDVRDGSGAFAVMKRTAATGASFPCGNAVPDEGENCDDGNAVDGDGCDASCRPSGCGSGRISGAEECDDGNTAAGDGCSAVCTIEPGCGVLDVRGRWRVELNCAVRDAFEPSYTMYLLGSFTLDVGQRCADGAVSVRLPAACGHVQLGDGEASLECAESTPPLEGRLTADGSSLVFEDFATAMTFANPITPSTCALTKLRTEGTLGLQAEVDRPGHARRLVGAFDPDLVLTNTAGATCVEKHPTADFCFVQMTREGPAAGTCDLGCDDADPCTTDGCDAFALCSYLPVTEGASGAICSLRGAVETGDLCAGDRQRERARRLVGRLDPRRFDDAPPWMMRAELRTVLRLKSKVRVLATRGALSRPCSRAVLDGLRTVGGTIRADLRTSRLPRED